MIYRFFSIICCCFVLSQGMAQTKMTPSVLSIKNDETALLDSIAMLLYGETQPNNALSVRLGYTNKALFAGRDYGVNQSVLMPSLTYSHKSGLYGELSGYSYSQSQPRYELTMASMGYISTIGEKFLYLGEYSHSFLTKPDSNTALGNSITFYGGYDIGKYTASLSYTHLFGNNASSNLFVPSISRMFTIKKMGFIDKITITPSLSATIGKSNSFSNTFNPLTTGTNPFWNGTTLDTAALKNAGWTGGRPPWVTGNTSGTSGRPSGVGGPPAWVTNGQTAPFIEDKFGVMAYTLSLPISVKIKNFNLSFTPNIVKPMKLNSYESLNPRPQFNFTVGVSYGIKW